MKLFPEFTRAVAFGVVILAISLSPIWVVRWQTFYILKNQVEPEGSSSECLNLLPRSPLTFAGLDLERANSTSS